MFQKWESMHQVYQCWPAEPSLQVWRQACLNMDSWHIGRHRPDNTIEEKYVRCQFIQKFSHNLYKESNRFNYKKYVHFHRLIWAGWLSELLYSHFPIRQQDHKCYRPRTVILIRWIHCLELYMYFKVITSFCRPSFSCWSHLHRKPWERMGQVFSDHQHPKVHLNLPNPTEWRSKTMVGDAQKVQDWQKPKPIVTYHIIVIHIIDW